MIITTLDLRSFPPKTRYSTFFRMCHHTDSRRVFAGACGFARGWYGREGGIQTVGTTVDAAGLKDGCFSRTSITAVGVVF